MSQQPSAPPPPPTGEAPPSPPPPSGTSKPSDNTIMLILSYLGLLALIPLLVEKDDSEVQWHAKNGLVITAAVFAYWFLSVVLSFVPFLGLLLIPVGFLVFLGWLIVIILGIVKATSGQRLVIPVLSDLVKKF